MHRGVREGGERKKKKRRDEAGIEPKNKNVIGRLDGERQGDEAEGALAVEVPSPQMP